MSTMEKIGWGFLVPLALLLLAWGIWSFAAAITPEGKSRLTSVMLICGLIAGYVGSVVCLAVAVFKVMS
jgi:hypothetical protein